MNLKKISDSNLVTDFKTLVSQERELLGQILNHLKEIEARKIYLTRGFSSLFAFMTEEIGYSESAAQRRILAMRLIRDVPEVEAKIESGAISLTVASQMQSFLKSENQKRQSERQAPISRGEKLELIQNLQGTSSRECEQKLAQISPESALPKEKIKTLSEERTLIQFSASPNLLKKIQRLKALLSHQNPSGSLETLFEKLTELALDKLDPERREVRRDAKKCTSRPPAPAVKAPARSRSISPALRDQVFRRDQGRCQFVDPLTKRQCNSSHLLEIDHRFPFALGGEHSFENLQLLCRAHNQRRAALLFETCVSRDTVES